MTLRPYGILHLARTPFTGVWSVMRNLAIAQAQAGYPVALGVLVYPRWTDQYDQALLELKEHSVATFTVPIPDWPYTALFPYLVAKWQFTGHPWEKWIAEFCREQSTFQCVIHCHNAWLSGAYLPYRAKEVMNIRFIATYHGIQGASELRRSGWRRVVHRWLAHRFISYGGTLASVDYENTYVAEELFNIPHTMFQVIPNGVPRINCSTPAPFPTDLPTVGHVGTFNEGKGWRLTAEAVKLANERGLKCRFVAVGSGPEIRIAQRWCAEHSSIATFLGHVENAAEVVTPHLTLFALPSRSEGSPMAAIEALAAGVPVIGTAVSGLSQIIIHDHSGLVVTRTVESIADAICDALSSPNRLKSLNWGARALYVEQFNIERCVAAYDLLYRNALTN